MNNEFRFAFQIFNILAFLLFMAGIARLKYYTNNPVFTYIFWYIVIVEIFKLITVYLDMYVFTQWNISFAVVNSLSLIWLVIYLFLVGNTYKKEAIEVDRIKFTARFERITQEAQSFIESVGDTHA